MNFRFVALFIAIYHINFYTIDLETLSLYIKEIFMILINKKIVAYFCILLAYASLAACSSDTDNTEALPSLSSSSSSISSSSSSSSTQNNSAKIDKAEKAKTEQEEKEAAEKAEKERIAQKEAQKQQDEADAQVAQEQPQANVYYKNCSEARAAGAAPVYQGQPGYGRHLDRDGDGIGCEK